MVAFFSHTCKNCGKHGPYMGGYEGDDWFLACLWCGKVERVSEFAAKEQIRFQQEITGSSCPNCGVKSMAEATIPDCGIEDGFFHGRPMYFRCSHCGHQEEMNPINFAAYMMKLGGLLNP